MIKRSLDVALSAAGLLILGPLLLAVMALLRLTGEGEVFFRQERIGYRNQPFRIVKFVTMLRVAANPGIADYIVGEDPRILPFGRHLRKSKINELLQLWDVLCGRMSLVGPRPQMHRVHSLYPVEYARVLDTVRPGITGVGSIVFRDEEAILAAATDRDLCYAGQIVPYKARLEAWYVANRTIALDMALIGLTVWYLLFPASTAIMAILPAELRCDMAKFGENSPIARSIPQ